MADAPTKPPSEHAAALEWENEGGSLLPKIQADLPEGIIAIPTIHYRVGPYTYLRVEDAMVQYRRQYSGR